MENETKYGVSYIADKPDNITFNEPEPWNVQAFRKITMEMAATYKMKNLDYGDSFAQSVNEWGPVAGLVRIQDKFNRAKNILMSGLTPKVEESVIDTLTDLANYAIMLRMALTVQPVDFENV